MQRIELNVLFGWSSFRPLNQILSSLTVVLQVWAFGKQGFATDALLRRMSQVVQDNCPK